MMLWRYLSTKPLCPSHHSVGVKQSVVSISSSRDWPRFTGSIMLIRSVRVAGLALLAAIEAKFRLLARAGDLDGQQRACPGFAEERVHGLEDDAFPAGLGLRHFGLQTGYAV